MSTSFRLDRAALTALLALIVCDESRAQQRAFDNLHAHLPAEARSAMLPPDGQLVLLDVDGDGDTDAVLGTLLLRNDGVAGFHSERWVGDLLAWTLTGDLDRDGDLDLVVGTACGINPGSTPFVWRTGCFGLASALALADVDADGDLDVLAYGPPGGCAGSALELHRNDGVGVFARDVSALPIVQVPFLSSPAVGDVDRDGDLDLLLQRASCVPTGGSTTLLRNDGTGRFLEERNRVTPTLAGRFYELADLDGDGALDLLLISSSDVRLLWNDGRGGFALDSLALPGLLSNPGGRAAIGDLDRDGDLDLVLGSSEVLWNRAPRRFSLGAPAKNAFPSGGVPVSFRVADLDGDADLDLLVAPIGPIARSLVGAELYLNDGAGRLAAADALELGVPAASVDGASADFDLDGDLDLVVANGARAGSTQGFDPSRLHLNDGSGRFADASAWLPAPLDDMRRVVAGDLDGDGDQDLVFGSTSGSLHFLRNSLLGPAPMPQPIFAGESGAFPPLGGAVNDIALADLDGDGDLDVVCAIGGGPAIVRAPNRYFRNDGSGRFADASGLLPTSVEDTRGLAIGDYDGDGDLDVATSNRTNAQGSSVTVELYQNDGAGTFTDASAGVAAPVVPSFDIVFLDVDGDLDLDLVTGGSGRVGHVLLGDGAGIFVELPSAMPAIFPLPESEVVHLDSLDLEGDGDPDFLVGASGVLRNRGNGSFEVLNDAVPPLGGGSSNAEVADLDGDGDADYAVLRRGTAAIPPRPNLIVANLSRQLGYRASPRIGKRHSLELYGDPGALAFLLAAPVSARIALPPFGTLHLDPARAILAGSASLDALGRATIAARVPFDPSLIGRSVYWQTLGGAAPRFSNLEITTFRAL